MINIIIYLCLFTGILYSLFIIYCSIGLYKHKSQKKETEEYFSIIIAAKNESDNIEELINCINSFNYSNYEVVIIDDLSTDNTFNLLEKFSKTNDKISIYKVEDYLLSEELNGFLGKKRALQLGIRKSKYEFLVFTDADCLPSSNWLKEINEHIFNQVDFIAGYSPLVFSNNCLINKLINFERSSIFALTAGSFGVKIPLTCTARNMVYRRTTFDKIGGFSRIKHILSGDDDLMLLLQRHHIRKYNFMYSPESIVPAKEKKDLKSQVNQETRRASKFKYYPNYLKVILLNTLIFYITTIIVFIYALMNIIDFNYLITILMLKIIAEFILIKSFYNKMEIKFSHLLFFIAESFYIFYFIFFGIKGTLGKYKWKS